MNNPIQNLSRRGFLQGAAGLTLGLSLPAFAAKAGAAAAQAAATPFEPTPFLRIGADNSVTVLSKHLEMGQGTYTGLATIVAEELDASWAQVKVEGAPAGRGSSCGPRPCTSSPSTCATTRARRAVRAC